MLTIDEFQVRAAQIHGGCNMVERRDDNKAFAFASCRYRVRETRNVRYIFSLELIVRLSLY